jgi:hypothetical protein
MRNKTYLTMVVETLKNVSDKDFDMNKWLQYDDCGTVGCAIGHFIDKNPNCGLVIYNSWPRYKEKNGFFATAERFNISCKSSKYLFSPDHYKNKSRRNVMRRINKFIKTGTSPNKLKSFID